jgi:spore coat protein A, manganese oxidase
MLLNSLPTSADKWGHTLPRLLKALSTTKPGAKSRLYRIEMQAIKHDFHPKLQNIPMWSFGKTSPGFVIEAEVDHPVEITWFSKLVNQTLNNLIEIGTRQGMEEDHMLEKPHNQVHLHGARVPWTSDGFPMSPFHPNEGRIFHYPNKQAAATLWYHDHTMDVTRLNVYAGLFGIYLLRHPKEKSLLPAGDLEILLILQDKSFSDDAKRLKYEQKIPPAVADITPEFIGDYPVVNGKIWPRLELQPRIYRLRLVNGANTRFFNLSVTTDNSSTPPPFWVIGTDGGFLDKPKDISKLLIAPGERYDLLLDLRNYTGTNLILKNDAAIPFSNDGSFIDPADMCDEILKIIVSGKSVARDSRFDPNPITNPTFKLPAYDDPIANDPILSSGTAVPNNRFIEMDKLINAIDISKIDTDDPSINNLVRDFVVDGINIKLRRFKLEEYKLEMHTLQTTPKTLIPTVLVNGKDWKSAEPVKVAKDAIEVWEFINTTPDTHPMHLHLVQFKIMGRTALDIMDDPSRLTADLPEPKTVTGYKIHATSTSPEPYEQGWKDTVQCHPNESTRIIAKFDGYTGEYVYHCHILEHEDMGMMYPLNVD